MVKLVKCPASPLHSEEYHIQVYFSRKGDAIIQCILWPTYLEEINYLRLLNGLSCEEDVQRLERKVLEKVDQSISASTEKEVIKEQFGLSDTAADDISALVQQNQIHLDASSNVQSDLPLPSLKTLFGLVPEVEENIKTSARFRKKLQKLLMELSISERSNMTTEEFIQKITEEKVELSEVLEGTVWRLVIDQEEFNFYIESRLRDMNEQFDYIGGAYHFALGCVAPGKSFSIILQRRKVVECWTHSYSPIYLKAFSSPVLIEPVIGYANWKFHQDATSDLSVNVPDHKPISLAEAISLADSRKTRIRSSRSFEFVYSAPSKQIFVKKVAEKNPNCFTIDGQENVFFECQDNMVTRYFKRLNGSQMLLAEFATHYDFVGKSQSEEIFQLYHDKIDQITATGGKSVVGENYPDIILCANGDVLKRRKQFKVLTYPTLMDENEVRYSQVLLYYYPLESLEQVERSVDELFYKTVEDKRDRTVAKENERY